MEYPSLYHAPVLTIQIYFHGPTERRLRSTHDRHLIRSSEPTGGSLRTGPLDQRGVLSAEVEGLRNHASRKSWRIRVLKKTASIIHTESTRFG